MLQTVLPEELALILWYNKSRASSRICPACQRLYRVGDVLPDHALTGSAKSELNSLQRPSELEREQQLSGLCSSMCFILASFNQCDPRTTKAAWGHTANEINDESWAVLNGGSSLLLKDGPGQNAAKALVMIVRMTRTSRSEAIIRSRGIIYFSEFVFRTAYYDKCGDYGQRCFNGMPIENTRITLAVVQHKVIVIRPYWLPLLLNKEKERT
ncbi:hypothetical protein LENED_007212 [Lentinula edodes]|uniref:Uncharacterized protein n=1 Tax=Lentinula edodes TaxID=5353 RepID=A0A1Q3EDT6_LENED|nr:hypothetical protein LENED_007212 [Lentinula edodes]